MSPGMAYGGRATMLGAVNYVACILDPTERYS